MKKVILSVAVVLGLGISQINAQKLSGGIKAESNMSNFILSDLDNAESSMKIGAGIGGFIKYDLNDFFAIQPELMLHFKSSEMEQNATKDDFQYLGFDLPVYAMGQWQNEGGNRFYAGFGPYIGLGLGAKYKDADIDLYEEVAGQKPMQRFDFGFGAQVGYEFNERIQINAGYKLGIIDALDAEKDNATMLPQMVSLGLGFRF
jgi:opacity protein-like surface antigen